MAAAVKPRPINTDKFHLAMPNDTAKINIDLVLARANQQNLANSHDSPDPINIGPFKESQMKKFRWVGNFRWFSVVIVYS